jgi:hypothetical protein
METKKDKIKNFNLILESFLSQTAPIVGTTYCFYFQKLIKTNAPLPIKYACEHFIGFKTQILNKDESYFHSDSEDLTSKFNEVTETSELSTENILSEIMRLKDIYYNLDVESRENVWNILQALLQLTIEYKELSE